MPYLGAHLRRLLVSVGMCGALILLGIVFHHPSPAYAADIQVTSLGDSGGSCPGPTCTLRAALAASQNGDTIRFGVSGTILLSSTLTIAADVTLDGPGASILAIDGQNAVRVFLVNSGVTAEIRGLTLQHGNSGLGSGGGISNSGTLTVRNSVIRDNVAPLYVGSGGGIANEGFTPLTVIDTTFTGNSADGGGGIAGAGDITVQGSTFSGNTAITGGAMALSQATATITNSTFSHNAASIGNAVWFSLTTARITNSTLASTHAQGFYPGTLVVYQAATAELRNTIVVGAGYAPACMRQISQGTVTSLGNNLSNDTTCFAGSSQGDIVTSAPVLGALALYAPGTTMTRALLPNSPAIDGVTYNSTDCGGSLPNAVTVDQRGVPRPQFHGAPRCDIGAYEATGDGAPTLTGLSSPQSTNEDQPLGPLPFTVADDVTPAGNLQVTARSSNQSIVADANIILGGTGGNRDITITPLPDRFGALTVTLTVSDGNSVSNTTFSLVVTSVNDPPVTLVPPSLTVDQSTELQFGGPGMQIFVADVDAGTDDLQVTITATNGVVRLTSVPGVTFSNGTNGSAGFTVRGALGELNAAFGGMTFTPTSGYTGPAPIQIVTSDRGNSGSGPIGTDTDVIQIQVVPRNQAPVVSGLGIVQGTYEDTPTQPIPFVVSDPDMPANATTLTVTAASANQTLLPDAGVQLGGMGRERTIRMTPAANQSGDAVVTLSVSDGQATTQFSLTLTVAPVNDAPMATNDSYTVSAGQSLSVPVASGVLANDADVDSPAASLSAVVVTKPAQGALTLNPNGSFSYVPVAGYFGTDSFSYRVSDGDSESAPATVTIAVVASQCSPRPRVTTRPVAGGGKLTVHIEATPSATQQNNLLQWVTFTQLDNARVSVNGRSIAQRERLTLAASAITADFAVERLTPGQATLVRFTVMDSCGEWKTFVGGGTGAGF